MPTDRVRAAVSPDGKLLATIGPNGETALVFETDSLKLRSPALVPPRHARTGGKSKVRAFAFSPDGKSLTVANVDGAVSRHDVSDEKGDGAPIAGCRGVGVVADEFGWTWDGVSKERGMFHDGDLPVILPIEVIEFIYIALLDSLDPDDMLDEWEER